MPDIEELVLKGKSFLESGDFDKALGFFEQALLLNPQNPDLWNYKGTALRSLGRYSESMECFNNSLKIDPRDKFSS
ncbi:MAG: tetratricopeptide repeat protein [Nitrosopumilus sp.]|nr:tetratricopeptide repeat protein [Nitrosopumilus sp.]MBT3574341.1 tetratricopeptide repeat protein [Nitrosopumilus sp.]MBT5278514.1 tetratricopeptide repeat protein [Nitrosopumilus sp.]MBT6397421.1 tetratricopeptide repeat protein [Nitrosopumilus sp.]MBT6807120.1 tetratricopeptide repeat protein [Nitrosopumilus sp.]